MTIKKYKSGLTVAIEENKALRSVTSGIMVGAGSAYETDENNGISHFIEHMQFKGTSTRSARDIVEAFDNAGSVFNAFTGKEYTCYYFKSIDEKLDECFGILCDLFLHSTYEQEELDRERKVILEEINMSKDEPDGVCYDVLYKTAYGGSLGMEILGSKKNVESFQKADILKYRAAHYLPSNTVVAFVGNISEAHALELVENYLREFACAEHTPPPVVAAQSFKSGYGEYIRDYEQSEISVAFPSLRLGDGRSAVLSALDFILGNGMSSRLFQRLREKMGLVYSVYTSPWMGKCNGLFSVCANVNAVNVAQSVAAIKDEIDKIVKHGVTDAETEKARTQLKVATLFGKENPMNYMLAVMRWRVLLDRTYDVDELISRINAVTTDDINKLAREIFSSEAAIAYAGKTTSNRIDKIFNGDI